MTYRMINGPAVRALRQALGIRQTDFATAVEITPGYLANIEAGRKQPAEDVARRMSERLAVPLDAITYPAPSPAPATAA